MGAWGPALFSDDVACDVRDTYRELLEDGITDADALSRVIDEFSHAAQDDDDGPVVWLALAVTMSKLGRLTDDIRQRAISIIDSGQDLRRWETDSRLRKRREAALQMVRDQLTGPQPTRRRLRPPKRHVTDLLPGQVVGYPTAAGLMCFRVARIDDHRLAVAPILVALDYDKGGPPSPRRLSRLEDRAPDRRMDRGDGLMADWFSVTFRPTADDNVDYAGAGFTVVGSMPLREGDETRSAQTYCRWSQLADDLDRVGGAHNG